MARFVVLPELRGAIKVNTDSRDLTNYAAPHTIDDFISGTFVNAERFDEFRPYTSKDGKLITAARYGSVWMFYDVHPIKLGDVVGAVRVG
jgi:hypothetical protein